MKPAILAGLLTLALGSGCAPAHINRHVTVAKASPCRASPPENDRCTESQPASVAGEPLALGGVDYSTNQVEDGVRGRVVNGLGDTYINGEFQGHGSPPEAAS